MRVVVVEHLSLDGVLQAPGGPEEDTRDEFRHGGWAQLHQDPAVGEAMGSVMSDDFAWLLGRRSYDQMLGYWNEVGGPFKDGLNGVDKYVVTRDPAADLPWPATVPLTGDAATEVAALRELPGGDLVVMGSGELVRSLLPHGLVDEMLLIIHPVVLGSGRRLFGAGKAPVGLDAVSADLTSTGVLLARYRARPQS